MAALRALELEVSFSGDGDGPRGYLAASDTARADALNAAFRDPAVRAVFCARGGYGTSRLLPLLDTAALRRDPKVVMGFSDITALLGALERTVRLVTFHGPVVAGFSPDPAERERWARLLFSDAPPEIGGGDVRALQSGAATAPIIGGNLSVFCALLGTPFQPAAAGRILFLEEVGEPLYRIDRMLTQLRLAGVLERIAGLALGRFAGCGPAGDIEDLVLERLDRPSIPVLSGLPAGHGPVNQPFPLGLRAAMDGRRRSIRFPEPATAP
jgi:muramoyltetrapeptide carboxypeptidase